jgi:hypothetical protein
MSTLTHRIPLVITASLVLIVSPAQGQTRTSTASARIPAHVRVRSRDLGTLVEGGFSGSLAINNHGHVVGWADLDSLDVSFSRQVPVLWTPQRGYGHSC